jgi:uncharacterized protein
MALFKAGFFHMGWQTKTYMRGIFIVLPFGLILVGLGLYNNIKRDFSLEYSMFIGSQYNYWGSILVAFGYACAVMLMAKTGFASRLQNRLAAIGKTAFSNYILHTVVFTSLFYGYGLGLFGDVLRWQQLLLVIVMWMVQLWCSAIWLKYYRFGPLEWVWRSLTYARLQPMKR